jgi:hypothetical protein
MSFVSFAGKFFPAKFNDTTVVNRVQMLNTGNISSITHCFTSTAACTTFITVVKSNVFLQSITMLTSYLLNLYYMTIFFCYQEILLMSNKIQKLEMGNYFHRLLIYRMTTYIANACT